MTTDLRTLDLARLARHADRVREQIDDLDRLFRATLPAGTLLSHRGVAVAVIGHFPTTGRVFVEPSGGGPAYAVRVCDLATAPDPDPEPTPAAADAA